MDFLKDTLEQYGATAEFWSTAGTGDRDAGRDAAWDEVKSLIVSLPEAEARALLDKIMDESVSGNKPTYLSLAEIYAERGDAEAAAKARGKAYQSVLENYPDPEELSRLGYLLLKHCGVDELPLCEEDFGLAVIEFGDNDTLFIAPQSYDPKVPEFPEKAQTLTVAIRAFGLAWLYYEARYEHGINKSEAWHELLALEGLRVAFREAADLDAADKVCKHFFDTWLEDWADNLAGLSQVEPFIADFRATAAYLQGRQEAASSTSGASPDVGRDLLISRRLITWQLQDLLSEVRNKQLTAEEVDALSTAVVEKLEATSSRVVEACEEDLAREFGERWIQLPIEVRHLLSQAECLRSILHEVAHLDWSPVVLQYIRATETLLRRLGAKLDAQNLRDLREVNKGFPFATARIETFRNLFQRPQFAQLAPALGMSERSLIAELASDLDSIVRNYRTPHFHGAGQAYPLKVKELRKLLLGTEAKGDGLLWKINSLCTSD